MVGWFYDAIGAGKSYEKAFEWGKVAIELDLGSEESAKILILRKKEITTLTDPKFQAKLSTRESTSVISNQSTNQDPGGSVQQQIRQKQIDMLKAEIEVISNQWESALNDEQRLQLQRRIDQKLKQLGELGNG